MSILQDWKDHNTAELVNELRDIAIQYRDMQQLRERIAHVIRPLADRLYAIPEGWLLVPIEPTEEMRNEGREIYRNDGDEKDIYQAMLAAAPEYKP